MNEFKANKDNLDFIFGEIKKHILGAGGQFRLSLVRWREKRTIDQNSLYWKWLTEIDIQSPLGMVDSKHFRGNELWHEVFKKYFCPVKIITNGTNQIEIKSTTLLDVGEMTFYLNKVEQFCIERGITLTIPIDSEYAKFMEQQNA